MHLRSESQVVLPRQTMFHAEIAAQRAKGRGGYGRADSCPTKCAVKQLWVE